MNREGSRKVLGNAPVGFVRRKWGNYVFRAEGIDRRFYELCVMAELKNALRSGDVSIRGSRQFRDFEDYLMPRPEFERGHAEGGLQIAVAPSPAPISREEHRSRSERSLRRMDSRSSANLGLTLAKTAWRSRFARWAESSELYLCWSGSEIQL
jgi:hypothetical protein